MVFTVGLTGLGKIGMGFESDPLRAKPASHLGALKALKDELTLQYVCDVNPDLQRKAEEVYGSPVKFIDRTMDVLEEEVDVAVVATPPETHFSIVKLLAENGGRRPKLIFCEKPLAETSGEAKDLVEICQANNVSLTVNHSRRWDPAWHQIQRMITDKEEMGKLLFIHGLYSGDTMNVGVHMADLVNWFGAPKHSVSRIDASYLVFKLTVYGEKKIVRLACNGGEVGFYNVKKSDRYQDIKEPVRSSSDDSILNLSLYEQFAGLPKTSPMLNAYRNIVAHLSHGIPLECNGEDGVKAVQLVEQWCRA